MMRYTLLAAMMENGTIRQSDPEILAFSYTAPITALIHLCDREPEKESEAMEKLHLFTHLQRRFCAAER